jgi:(1->4)-alpha-D-glucan 1-alpha-D-glucosylmutase
VVGALVAGAGVTAGLEALARAHGIALDYDDIWGQRQHAAPEVLARLLAAMHVAAGDEAAVQASLAAAQLRRWKQPLPAAFVLDEAKAAELPLRLPAAIDATLAWRIAEEDGRSRSGEVQPQRLRELEHGAVAGEAYVARALPLPADLPAGYHRLTVLCGAAPLGETRVIVAPPTAYLPPALEGDGRIWGAAVQLYAVRSERNWGIGDYTDLATLVAQWGERGAGVLAVNPLHAMFPHNPEHASPYSPSSRLFLNVLYLDIEAVDEYPRCAAARERVRSAAFQSKLAQLRAADRVDYAAVAEVKLPLLEMLFEEFRRSRQQHGERARAFDAFRAARGEALRLHALYEALQEHFHRLDPGVWGWPVWPQQFRQPDSPAVQRFADERRQRIEFFKYLQWQADAQLGAVGHRSLALGLGVGLLGDLAVSVDRAGAEAWSSQDLYAVDASVGAPPDDFNLGGQNWGLPPLVPQALSQAGYAPFIATLRANMQHNGALRIDHVMALARLYWIPAGHDATQGAYVHYPFDDLLAIVRLESRRHRCLVIGEDLGTVPPEFRDKLAAAGVLSYRLLYFERDAEGGFLPPQRYPRQALVAASTHDLPTLAGWWVGRDIAVRAELGLFPQPQLRERQVIDRARDRARLLLALEREGLLPPGATVNPVSMPEMSPAFAQALHAYLARTPAKIALVQLEDVLGVAEQLNLPGTTVQYPNWRRRLPLPLEAWPQDERFAALVKVFMQERGSGRARARRGPLAAVIPRATYRVQLHRDFRFTDAAALVPYLAELAASHLYCSPILRARAGSRHGYDIVDHDQLNPEIGSRDDFERLVAELRRHGMGLLVDIVPNHMGVLGGDNGWWLDVLENGPSSQYAEYFDIDWQAADPAIAGRVLLPILGDQYGVVLERGELRLAFDAAGSFSLNYYEHRLPIDPATYPALLAQAARQLAAGAVPAAAIDALASLATALGHLPPRSATEPQARAERSRDKEVHKGRLAQLARDFPPLAEAIERALASFAGTPGDRASFDALDALIEAQGYRLAYWRVAADEINYRRFFDINDLAALRMEREEVFEATHKLVLELAASGKIDGLRIDHPDGLLDPAAYFVRLQNRYAELAGGVPPAADADQKPLYVAIEKILAAHEHLPERWAVHGTTGYRFATVINGLFVDTRAKSPLDRAWRAFVRDEAEDFEKLAYRCRRLVMATSLAGELTVLANALLRLARAERRTRDFTANSLRLALAEVVAGFPVYRTYVVDKPSAQDRRYIDWAVGRARRRGRATDATVLDFVHNVLLGRLPAGADPALLSRYREFTRRLQQFTAPVAAKGIEDTALYRHHRLAALDEVGCDPDDFGFTVSAFHGASRDRAARWPHTMLASSTHDTKRSEDVRARLDVISELPAAWRLAVRRFARINRSKRRTVEDGPAPSRNDEYLLYQILVGTFPAGGLDEAGLAVYRQRIVQYMLKAAREAKQHTSWINPNAAYETALAGFIEALLARADGNLFLDELRAALPPFAWWGAFNSLSMTLLKLASPGVPDIYQGEEMIELALVDPDNRRPVDFETRRRLLAELAAASDGQQTLRELLAAPTDGRAKLWTIARALRLRRADPDLFADGEYLPLAAEGERAQHLLAFARRHRNRLAVAIAGRLYAGLGLPAGKPPVGALWRGTRIDLPPAAGWCDVLSGARFAGAAELEAVLAAAPLALLYSEAADSPSPEIPEGEKSP